MALKKKYKRNIYTIFAPLLKVLYKMESLKHFILPLSGLYKGEHHYTFKIDKEFFDQYEESPIKNGSLTVDLFLDKRPDLIELKFNLSGTVVSECDRCTANIDLPIENKYRSLIKTRDDGTMHDELEDVIYISPNTEDYNVAPLVYDVICLALPMIKFIDCEDKDPLPCNQEVLNHLNVDEEETESEEKTSSIWDGLKGLNLD